MFKRGGNLLSAESENNPKKTLFHPLCSHYILEGFFHRAELDALSNKKRLPFFLLQASGSGSLHLSPI